MQIITKNIFYVHLYFFLVLFLKNMSVFLAKKLFSCNFFN